VRRALLGVAAALLLALPARSQGFLYDPEPPAGAAFLRYVNATGAEVSVRAEQGAARLLGTANDARVSPYTIIERVQGRDVAVEFPGGRRTLRLAPGSFTTLLLVSRDGRVAAEPVTDQAEFNQLRARLSFYNATAACADGELAIMPAGTAVFRGIAAGAAQSRSVNPVEAELAARCGGEAAPLRLSGLEAGGMYSIWLMRPGAAPIAFITRDSTERRR
jgi:hypothetical protein